MGVRDDAFCELVRAVTGVLRGTGDGDDICRLLRGYDCGGKEWLPYSERNDDVIVARNGYTRNCLIKLPENRGAVLALVWPPGNGSAVHGHRGCECWVKVLSGELTETIYDDNDDGDGELVLKSERYIVNEVTHINDEIGRHCMVNESENEYAVSLHVYSKTEMIKSSSVIDCELVTNREEEEEGVDGIYKDYCEYFKDLHS